MDTVSYSSFRKNLATVIDQVNEDHVPVMITRQNGESAVIMSAQDFRSYEETSHLMASAKNAERLNRAIEAIESGNSISHELLDE